MIKSIFKNFYEDMLSCKVSLLHPWLYALIMSLTRFRVKSRSIVASMSRNSLLKTGAISEVKVFATGFEPTTNKHSNELDPNWTWTEFEMDSNEHSTIQPNWPNNWAMFVSTYLYGAFDCMFLSSQVGISE